MLIQIQKGDDKQCHVVPRSRSTRESSDSLQGAPAAPSSHHPQAAGPECQPLRPGLQGRGTELTGRGRGEGAWSSDLKDRRVSGTRLAPRKQNERGVHSAGIWKGRRLSALLDITREEHECYPCNCFAAPAFSTRRHRVTIPFFFLRWNVLLQGTYNKQVCQTGEPGQHIPTNLFLQNVRPSFLKTAGRQNPSKTCTTLDHKP